MMTKLKSFFKSRHFIQALAALLQNINLKGFATGTIYTGNMKYACVPGLNCYSCPGAVGSCPIGALQGVLGSKKFNFSFYVVGILLLFGVLFGRLICGFLCVIGFIQDLLYKIKTPKFKVPEKLDGKLRYLKYVILAVFVVGLPILATNQFGMGDPYFCKWICPAGTLQGGIPLVSTNENLQQMVGFLFNWKIALLIGFIVSSIFIYRPFCKYICPLGAIYSLFNKFSLYQMDVDKSKCTGCKACERSCNMGVKITKNINSAECIRCGECKKTCEVGAISSGFACKKKESSAATDTK